MEEGESGGRRPPSQFSSTTLGSEVNLNDFRAFVL